MASLNAFPNEISSASQVLLHRLPLPYHFTESDKCEEISADSQAPLSHLPSPYSLTELDKNSALSRVLIDAKSSWLNPIQKLFGTVLTPSQTLRNLWQIGDFWINKGSSTVYTSETELQLLGLLYSFKNLRAVHNFLEINRFLFPLLIEASNQIREYFPNSQVSLEIDADPEVIDDQRLVALIATSYSPEMTHYRLKQFDENWWLDALDQAQRKFYISVEFK